MAKSELRNRLSKNKYKKILEFIKENLRYFVAGALFVVLVLVLVNCAEPKKGDGAVDGTEVSQETEEAFQVDAYEEVNALFEQYYTAYAAGDMDTLASIATPLSENEKIYITQYSQYLEACQNIKCYTKSGLDDKSYLVFVTMEFKFTGVDTAAPGMDYFYVRTNDDGSLYIDNLYSQYNRGTQENAQDTSVKSLFEHAEMQEDVIALQNEVWTRYEDVIASDENLATMVQTTVPNAINEWVNQVVAQNAAQAEGTEAPAEDTETPVEGTEAPVEAPVETPEETPAEEPRNEQLATKDRVNIRAAADTSSEKLATVDAGTVVTRTGIEGDWSVIDYNGTPGYIKNEFLTYDLPSADAGTNDGVAADNGDDGDTVSLAEGTKVTLQNTVNIRSGMSETSDRIGTAYAGETVTVVMSYADGWTKVKWSGEIGYIKSSLLK